MQSSNPVLGKAFNQPNTSTNQDSFQQLTRDQIANLGYMHPGRVDVITAGALVLSRVMAATGATEFVASESDILDGIAWKLAGE